jgi:hypothetical protein
MQPISADDIDQLERGASSEEDGRVGKTWLGDLEGGVPESVSYISQLVLTSPR